MQTPDYNSAPRPLGVSLSEPPPPDPRRAGILVNAKRLFSQKGYQATTIAEIAAGANTSVGTLYKFFKDKHALYQILIAETLAEFETAARRALRETPGDASAGIRRYIEVGVELFVKHLPLIRVYFAETGAAFLDVAAGLEDEVYAAYDRIVAALTEAFRRGIEQGLFVEAPPDALALGLEGVHNSFLATLVREPGRYTPEQIADLTQRVFFEAILKKPT